MKSSNHTKKELMELWSQEIQRAGTLTVLHTNAVSQRIGISATEFEAVDVISHNQPMTAGNLAICCGLTTGAVTGLVDRLVDAGYVNRASDPNDRRKVLLVPVEDKQRSKKVRELYQPISEGYERIAIKYSKEELEFLIKAQSSLNDMAEDAIQTLHMRK